MKRLTVACCCLFVLSACNQPNDAPEYDLQTIDRQFETFSDWKKDKESAMATAIKEMDVASRTNCRSAGVGWAFQAYASEGEMECEESSEGVRCRKKGVTLNCRRINER